MLKVPIVTNYQNHKKHLCPSSENSHGAASKVYLLFLDCQVLPDVCFKILMFLAATLFKHGNKTLLID